MYNKPEGTITMLRRDFFKVATIPIAEAVAEKPGNKYDFTVTLNSRIIDSDLVFYSGDKETFRLKNSDQPLT